MSYKRKLFDLLPQFIKINLEDKIRREKNIKKYNPEQSLNPIFQSSIAVLDYYQCIFIHIPKNAGLSICYTLFGNTGGSHRKIMDYKKIFSPSTFKKYYKFTFVRNPWDRLVSTYFFLKKGGLTEKDKIWADLNISTYSCFEDFVNNWLNEDNISKSLHFQHQYVFLEDENGNLPIDFIGRFENIEKDFLIISEKLGIDRELKKSNSSERNIDYRSYYNDETRRKVLKVYKKDICLFNYNF